MIVIQYFRTSAENIKPNFRGVLGRFYKISVVVTVVKVKRRFILPEDEVVVRYVG